MKKALAIVLSLVMLLSAVPIFGVAAEKTYTTPASAYASYDADAVAAGEVDSLSYDQIAAIILDYVDRKIAAKSADLDSFEVDALGQSVSVDLNIGSLDGILSYQQYLQQLGGDFATLNTEAINGLSRAGGDINFIYGILQFVADNSVAFGKVFQWEEGQTFDFGKVGEYIETLPADDEIRVFYDDYLIGNDIQQKFTDEIAREMGYTAAEGETLDDVINNGILDLVTGFFKDAGLLSDEAADNIKANFNLRTTDIYRLFRDLVSVLQSDNQVKINTYYTFVLDNYIRAALKIALGSQPVVGAPSLNDVEVVGDFNAAYTDLPLLYELSGGTVYFKATDGAYYCVTVSDTEITSVKDLTWSDSFANFDPPEVAIYSKAAGEADKVIGERNCGLVKTYYPMDDAYDLYVYSPYGDELGSGVPVTGDTVPEEYTALMTAENEKTVDEFFAIQATQGETILAEQLITFSEIEQEINDIALPVAQQMAKTAYGDAATVNSINVTFTYKGYATEDEFIMQVTAAAKANVTGMAPVINIPITVDIDVPANIIENPAATIVVDGLTGSEENELSAALDMLDFFDTDFVIDYSFIDLSAYYDAYKGVIGQANHVLCKAIEMLASDEGYSSLALVDGDNSNLTDNLQKICNKLDGIMTTAKSFMDEQGFTDFIGGTGVSDLFASEHGFNAGMVYNLDFSSVESLYVCLTEIVLDFIDDGTAGVVNDLHTALEGLETLDQFAVALTDYALDKALPAINNIIADINTKYGTAFAFTYTNTPSNASAVTTDAEDIIMTKGADLALALIEFAVDDVANTLVNRAVDSLNAEVDLDVPHVAFEFGVAKGASWQATLGAIVDRIVDLSNGILIAAGTIEDTTPLFDKLSILGNALIPFSTMFSNCASASFNCDFGVLSDIAFDEALAGDFDSFLALFEAYDVEAQNKKGDVACGVSVNYALIKASDYIVDAFFPDTVQAELYSDSAHVQDDFTSSSSDNDIATRNMESANARKTHIVPGVLDLVREAGMLPALVLTCEHADTVSLPAVAATCVATGYTAGVYCNDCERYISGHEEIAIDAANHVGPFTDIGAVAANCSHTGLTAGKRCNACGNASEAQNVIPVNPSAHGNVQDVAASAATCTTDGCTAGRRCADCGVYVSGHERIPSFGHTDADENGICDTCNTTLWVPDPPIDPEPEPELNFIQKIQAFFQKILDWFKGLFG